MRRAAAILIMLSLSGMLGAASAQTPTPSPTPVATCNPSEENKIYRHVYRDPQPTVRPGDSIVLVGAYFHSIRWMWAWQWDHPPAGGFWEYRLSNPALGGIFDVAIQRDGNSIVSGTMRVDWYLNGAIIQTDSVPVSASTIWIATRIRRNGLWDAVRLTPQPYQTTNWWWRARSMSLYVCGEADKMFVRPIEPQFRISSQASTTESPYTATWQSNSPAFVLATMTGMVTFARPITDADCNQFLEVGVPVGFICIFRDQTDGIVNREFLSSRLDPVWIAEICDGAWCATQIFKPLPSPLVENGQVFAGCPIGIAVPEIFNPLRDDRQRWWTFSALEENGVPASVSLQTRYEDRPNPSCEPQREDGCLGDFDLRNEGNWQHNGVWNSFGVRLSAGQGITSRMMLDTTRHTEMIVRGGAGPGNRAWVVQLGTDIQSGSTFDSSSPFIRLGPAVRTPDGGGLYTVAVRNVGTAVLQIDFICVRYVSEPGAPPRPPPPPPTPPVTPPGGGEPDVACGLTNNSFESGGSGWTTGGASYANGAARLRNGNSVTQTNIRIKAGTYVLSANTGIWGSNTFSTSSSTTGGIRLSFSLGSASGDIGSETWAAYANVTNIRVMSRTVTIPADAVVTLTVTAHITNAPAEVQGVLIRSLCIGFQPITGGPSGGGETGGGGFFFESCERIETPALADGIGRWINWLWAGMRSFYTCELIPLLNDIFLEVQRIYIFIRWSFIWGQTVFIMQTEWVTEQALPWLGGHLSNIATGRTTVVTDGECNNIFCLIENLINGEFFQGIFATFESILDDLLSPLMDGALALLGGTIGFLFDLIIAIVDVAMGLLSIVLSAINRILSLMASFAAAFNTTDVVVIDGLPNCNVNPQGNGWCITLWVMEHTVFSGRGALLLPLLLSFAYAIAIIRAIKTLQRTVVEAGSVS